MNTSTSYFHSSINENSKYWGTWWSLEVKRTVDRTPIHLSSACPIIPPPPLLRELLALKVCVELKLSSQTCWLLIVEITATHTSRVIIFPGISTHQFAINYKQLFIVND